MDDGGADDDLELSSLCAAFLNDDPLPPGSCFMDTLEGLACTHTHTCNPPVDDPSHTHTCVHVHTKTVGAVAAPPTDAAGASEMPPPATPPSASGNRAAVRRYREKRRAQAASLEEEVARLRALTQQLLDRNAALQEEKLACEAEAARLRFLLVDIRGRIEGEIGASFQHHIQRPPVISSSNIVDDLQVSTGGGGGAVNNHHGALVVLGAGAAAAAQGTRSSCDFRCNDQMYYHCNSAAGTGTGSMQGAFRGRQVVRHGANIQCTGSSTSRLPPREPVSVCVSHGGVDTGPAGAGGLLPNVANTSDGR